MSIKLIIFSTILSLLSLLFIFKLIKKEKLVIKYALVWILSILFVTVCVLIPNFMNFISTFLGFKTPSNMLLVMLIGVLFVMCISLTVIVSGLKETNKKLIQEISMLKSKDSE